MWDKSQKYKDTRNNYSKILIVLGALKSLFCFPLDIDLNDILKYCTNYLLRKCRKKAMANKQGCFCTRFLIVTFHEIAIKYGSDLKLSWFSQIFLRTITLDRRGSFTSNFVKRFIYLGHLSWIFIYVQKQPPRGIPRTKCSENMQQFYWRTPMPKCDFNTVALQLY